MYPRNAASPPRIAVGPVVQISDGAVQTTGCSVVVRVNGGNETAGGGTVAYGASSGIVYYTPTQAETDYTDFCVVAYKAGCIPASVTIITTAVATAGQVDIGKIGGTAVGNWGGPSSLPRNDSNGDAQETAYTGGDLQTYIGRIDRRVFGSVLFDDTIATLASQTSFTLDNGSTDNNAYLGCLCLVRDASVTKQRCVGLISAYDGATQRVTLAADPGVFTMAVGDQVTILPLPDVLRQLATMVTTV